MNESAAETARVRHDGRVTPQKQAKSATRKQAAAPRLSDEAPLFGGYDDAPSFGRAFDEMFADDGTVRTPYKRIFGALSSADESDLAARVDALGAAFIDQGITFSLEGRERPFPLDLVPRVIAAAEWNRLEKGIKQRVQALEMFLDDIYSEQEILRDGVVPKRLVTSCAHFHRQAAGIRPPNGVRIHVAGIDLIRDEQGDFRVLEDNVRVPSGVSYVIANRRAMANVFPEAFATMRIRPVHHYPRILLDALRAAAPEGRTDPTVVVLTPGVYNSAYFEHTLLARMMGVELVEGRDLVVRGGEVRMRTTRGEERVDVIYRRVDDDFLDPVHFRRDSMLGVTGLISAVRAGRVTLANAIGNGVADDKLVYSYVPDLIRYYLDEEPILHGVDTYRCNEPEALQEVLSRLDEMVVKPVDGSGGKGLVIGPQATRAELDELRAIAQNCDAFLLDLEARERARSGIANLRVQFNRVHGFYIEVTSSQVDRVPEHRP